MRRKDSFADVIRSMVDIELDGWKETPTKLPTKRKLDKQRETSKSAIYQKKVKMRDTNEQQKFRPHSKFT